MDLSRAKSILIMAFLILNIFLISQLWQQQSLLFPNISQAREEEKTQQILEEANLKLIASLSRQIQKAAFLTVSPLKIARDDLIISLLGNSVPEYYRDDSGIEVYSSLGRRLAFKSDGSFNFQINSSTEHYQENLNKARVKEIAEEFLVEANIYHEDAQFDEVKYQPSQNNYIVKYYQKIDSLPLFTGYMNLFIDNRGVVELTHYWVEPLGFSGEEKLLIPVTIALQRFAETHQPLPAARKIVEISLGYYSHEYYAERWDIVPVWRIKTDSGEVSYINAYTGEQENKKSDQESTRI